MKALLPVVVAILAGAALGTQSAINSELGQHIGQLRAVLVSVAVSILTVSILLVFRSGGGSFAGLSGTPRWAFTGGVLGVVVLLGSIIAVPRIGVAATAGLLVTAQLLAAAVIDRFGLLGAATRPLSPSRLAGLVLLIVAVALVTKG